LPPGLFLLALLVLVGISFSETTLVSCLSAICDGTASSRLLEIFKAPRGEEEGAKWSGEDARGEECLPLAVVLVDVGPDLWVVFGGPPTMKKFQTLHIRISIYLMSSYYWFKQCWKDDNFNTLKSFRFFFLKCSFFLFSVILPWCS
jgi:hypothetical protein